jgi:hypothetical protein
MAARNGHLESFSHSKKLAKLTEGKIVTSFFGTFWGENKNGETAQYDNSG